MVWKINKTPFRSKAFKTFFYTLALVTLVVGPVVAEKSDFGKAVDLIREKKFVEAFDIFERLAHAYDHDAQFNTAVLLRKGIGRPSNYPAALKWAWLAELGGNIRASELREELVELMPESGLNAVRETVKGILQARLDAGVSVVILQMAEYHLNVEAEPDYKNAYALRSLAAALSIKNASDLRDQIEPELEPEDLIAAQNIAVELFSSVTWLSGADDE